jgi:hypothetical protein
MDEPEVGRLDVLARRGGVEEAVEGVPGFEDHLVAGLASEGGRDVGVPAVVARVRLGGQGEAPIDPNLVRRHDPAP